MTDYMQGSMIQIDINLEIPKWISEENVSFYVKVYTPMQTLYLTSAKVDRIEPMVYAFVFSVPINGECGVWHVEIETKVNDASTGIKKYEFNVIKNEPDQLSNDKIHWSIKLQLDDLIDDKLLEYHKQAHDNFGVVGDNACKLHFMVANEMIHRGIEHNVTSICDHVVERAANIRKLWKPSKLSSGESILIPDDDILSGIDMTDNKQSLDMILATKEELGFATHIDILSNTPILKIRGVLIAEGVWRGVKYSYDQMKAALSKFANLKGMIIHGRSTEFGSRIIGQLTKVASNDVLRSLCFEADITDDNAANLVRSGYLNAVSIRGGFESLDSSNNPPIGIGYNPIEWSLTGSPVCTNCMIFSSTELSKSLDEVLTIEGSSGNKEGQSITIDPLVELAKRIVDDKTLRTNIERMMIELDNEQSPPVKPTPVIAAVQTPIIPPVQIPNITDTSTVTTPIITQPNVTTPTVTAPVPNVIPTPIVTTPSIVTPTVITPTVVPIITEAPKPTPEITKREMETMITKAIKEGKGPELVALLLTGGKPKNE